MQNVHVVQHYAMNALLYLHTIKENYIAVYNEFITQITNICKSSKNISKRIFANFTHNPTQIAGNYKFSKRNPN